MNPIDKIESILDHIELVQRNCFKLAKAILTNSKSDDDISFARMLISNGQVHDNSKFSGIEWKHLFEGDSLLGDVVMHHANTNCHHPEYWGSIHSMPDIYIAEMVCDCCARSSEFGTNIREWFEEEATIKYGFKMDDEVGQKISKYLDLLLAKPFRRTK